MFMCDALVGGNDVGLMCATYPMCAESVQHTYVCMMAYISVNDEKA